MKEIYRKTYC